MENTKTVYCVGWEYETGGGFNWYHTDADAKEAREAEEKNVQDPILKAENWRAFRFEVVVPADATAEEITDICDAELHTKY